MKLSAFSAMAFGIFALGGCQSDAGLMMQYYLTPDGARARDAADALGRFGGDSDAKDSHSSAAGNAEYKALGKQPTEELAYMQDSNLKQGLSSALSGLSTDDKTASARGQRLLELLMKSALAGTTDATVNWNTAKLQKLFGSVSALDPIWGEKPTLNFQKNGPLHYSVITLKKGNATQKVSIHYTSQSDDICRTADAVLKTSDKVGMDMVAKNGDRKTVPHPFGGKPCSKTELQRNFKSFALSLDNDSVRGSATPELAMIWKNDPKDDSVWLIHYRSPAQPESGDLLHVLQKFL